MKTDLSQASCSWRAAALGGARPGPRCARGTTRVPSSRSPPSREERPLLRLRVPCVLLLPLCSFGFLSDNYNRTRGDGGLLLTAVDSALPAARRAAAPSPQNTGTRISGGLAGDGTPSPCSTPPPSSPGLSEAGQDRRGGCLLRRPTTYSSRCRPHTFGYQSVILPLRSHLAVSGGFFLLSHLE